MERETGIEPVTSSLGSWRSTAELLPLNFVRVPFQLIQNKRYPQGAQRFIEPTSQVFPVNLCVPRG